MALPQIPPHGPLPDPLPSTGRLRPPAHPLPPFAQAIAEVLAGQRPPYQLAGRMTDTAYRKLHGGIGVYRGRHRPRLRSVRICRPAPQVAELSAVIVCGARSRALALRIEQTGSCWVCTRLETA